MMKWLKENQVSAYALGTLLLALLGVLGAWANRSYETRKEITRLEETAKLNEQTYKKQGDTLAQVMVERGQALSRVESLKRKLAAWDRGTFTKGADGSITKTWDRGSYEDDERITQLTEQLDEMSTAFKRATEREEKANLEASKAYSSLTKLQSEKVVGAKHAAVLGLWEVGTGRHWTQRFKLQGQGVIGSLILAAQFAPLGPWQHLQPEYRDPAQTQIVDGQTVLGMFEPHVGIGWGF